MHSTQVYLFYLVVKKVLANITGSNINGPGSSQDYNVTMNIDCIYANTISGGDYLKTAMGNGPITVSNWGILFLVFLTRNRLLPK